MLLLVVDTAGPTGGVLLAGISENKKDEGSAAEILGEVELHPRQFSAELIPAIAELLRAKERRLADVDAFAVVAGPGSFTGLRVGLSAVKAMAEVTGKPILTLSRLAILASMAARLPSERAWGWSGACRAGCGAWRVLSRRISRRGKDARGGVI